MLVRRLFFGVFLFSMSFISAAETAGTDYSGLSLEDLLNVKISVASKRAQTIQNSPGVVTLITAEEIRNSGARDLIDVLQLAPGLTFATDTEGVIGLAVRGNWAHEGKVLVMVDGEELNEMFYGTVQFGHEFPVNSISKIEIIRGPGSAIYGGHAELAVINIISKSAAELQGAEANLTYAQMHRTTGMQDVDLSAGKVFDNGWSLTSFLSRGRGGRSERNYTDNAGSTFNMKGNSDIKPSLINLGASNKAWDFRFIRSEYNTKNRTAYGTNAAAPVNVDFESILFGAKYRADFGSKFSVVPELHFRRQRPWRSTDELSSSVAGLAYNKRADEALGRLTATWNFTPNLTGFLGGEATHQTAHDAREASVWTNGKSDVFINRQAAFTELSWDNPVANLTFGARFQNQDGTGASFVPRFAAVRQFGDFNTKLLYSKGYRSPDFENIQANPDIRPETTEAAETELGYKINSQMYLTLNLFYITIDQPIVYDYTSGADSYFNFDTVGTHGAELDFRYTQKWGYLNFNYSHSRPHSSHVGEYKVAGHDDVLLGIPSHKATFNGNVKIWGQDTRLNLGATYLSERYGYDWDGAAMNIKKFGASWLVDCFLERRNFFVSNLTFGVGVHNLFDEDYRYLQTYNGGHPPQPAQSQEWMARLTLNL